MNITLTITPAAAASICIVASVLIGLVFYIGDNRWRRKTDDHEYRSNLTALLSSIQKEIAQHESRLNEGDRSIGRIEAMLTSNSKMLLEIQTHVARIDGACEARAKIGGDK